MKRAARAGLVLLGVVVAVAFIRVMMDHYGGGGSFSTQTWLHPKPLSEGFSTLTGTATENSAAIDSVTVSVTPHRTGFDSVFTADISVANHGGTAISSVTIKCEGVTESGDTAGHAMAELRQTFPAHVTTPELRVELPFIHRPANARCAVASFTRVR